MLAGAGACWPGSECPFPNQQARNRIPAATSTRESTKERLGSTFAIFANKASWLVRVEGRREQCHAAFMSGQAFGWIVEVSDHSGTKRYHVAVRNRVEAVNAVRRRVVGAALAHVQAVTMLSRRTVTVLLRLKPGEVAQVT